MLYNKVFHFKIIIKNCIYLTEVNYLSITTSVLNALDTCRVNCLKMEAQPAANEKERK